MTQTTTQEAWAYLSRVVEGPCAPLADLIAELGPEETAYVIRHNDHLPEVLEHRVRARRDWDCAQEDLQCAKANGFRLLTPDMPEWPSAHLAGFCYSAMYARQARDTAAWAPYALWIKGNIDILHCLSVAVVGSRHPSTEGKRITATLCAEIAAENVGLVSGLACGVDGIAHQTAVQLGAPTIAVVACGLDRVYPARHATLARNIAQYGLIVSEYPPGTRPARYRFLSRNRLLAAFSQGVLVTSAAWRSGALNTASWARDLGKPVMAVPHSSQDVDGAGCHRLIREGATLVTRGAEILEELGPIGQLALPLESVNSPIDRLTEDEKKVWNAISPFFSSSLEEICAETGLETLKVQMSLKVLIDCRLITVTADRWTRKETVPHEERVPDCQPR